MVLKCFLIKYNRRANDPCHVYKIIVVYYTINVLRTIINSRNDDPTSSLDVYINKVSVNYIFILKILIFAKKKPEIISPFLNCCIL